MSFFDYPTQTSIHTSFIHPEAQYWYPWWTKMRDAVMGEMEIKRKAERYLPRLEAQDPKDYAGFLERAVFFNMTSKTLTGLLGTLFRRDPIVSGIPDSLSTAAISKTGQDLIPFAREVAREVLTTGRYGVLLDMDEEGRKPPYFSGYIAENIVDWTIEEIDGRFVVTEVILRELRLARPLLNPISLTPAGQKVPKSRTKNSDQRVFSQDTTVTRAARRWIASYRVLRLEPEDLSRLGDPTAPRIYRQYFHTSDRGDASPEGTPYAVYTPTWRGVPFTFIPFLFVGPQDNTPDVQKSPLLDIALLNISHYQSYAMLEHGRFFTAMPVYYAPVAAGNSHGSYTLGPSVVWEVDAGQKPGIIEYTGAGLKFLESACDKKEDQIAALGGRLVGVEKVSAGESNNMLKTKEANEQALLLNLANVLDTTLTPLLRWWLQWQDMTPSDSMKATFETNKDFLASSIGAREFRAIQMMYEAGVLPVDVLYDYFRRAEVIPDWLELADFKTMLADPESFPNMADVLARQKGAPSAQSLWEAEHVLVDPQVVAVRGYDSAAPLGQEPLPGQTEGGAVTAEETAPTGAGGGDDDDDDSSGGPSGTPASKPTPKAAGKKSGGNDGTTSTESKGTSGGQTGKARAGSVKTNTVRSRPKLQSGGSTTT